MPMLGLSQYDYMYPGREYAVVVEVDRCPTEEEMERIKKEVEEKIPVKVLSIECKDKRLVMTVSPKESILASYWVQYVPMIMEVVGVVVFGVAVYMLVREHPFLTAMVVFGFIMASGFLIPILSRAAELGAAAGRAVKAGAVKGAEKVRAKIAERKKKEE